MTWPSHLNRPRPRSASGWRPGHASGGPSSPALASAGTASLPTSSASSPTAPRCRCSGSATPTRLALGACHLPGQPRRLRKLHPAQRLPGRHPPGSSRLRLRPLPRRPHRLAHPAAPDELTGAPPSRPDQPGQVKKCHKVETDQGRQRREPAKKPQVSGGRHATCRHLRLDVVRVSHTTGSQSSRKSQACAEPLPRAQAEETPRV